MAGCDCLLLFVVLAGFLRDISMFLARVVGQKTMRRVASVLLCTAASVYVFVMLIREFEAVAPLVLKIDLFLTAVAVFALMVAMMPLGLAVQINLRMLGYRLSALDASYAFFISLIGKYVPGKVLLFIIRGNVYAKYGVPLRMIAVSMTVEIAMFVGCAVAIAAVMIAFGNGFGFGFSPLLSAFFCIAILVGCSPPVVNRVVRWCHPTENGEVEKTTKVGYWHLLALLSVYCITWLGIGMAFMLLANAVVPGSGRFYGQLTAAFALACVGGYLAPFAPGGVGVREAALTAALATIYSPGTAAAIAILSRLWWTLGEFGCIVLFIALRWIANRRKVGSKVLLTG